MTKLNVLLAVTDKLRSKYKNMLTSYVSFFRQKQGAFRGHKSTYVPVEGFADEPSKRGFIPLITTVDEKMDYFMKESKEFIDALFSQEKTNASGVASAHLIVEDNDWGKFTSLELLRLRNLLESSDLGDLEGMLSVIPTRDESILWEKCAEGEYAERNAMQTKLNEGTNKTTTKREVVLEDPNLAKFNALPHNYTAKTTVITTQEVCGSYTNQNFSGEWSHYQRAAALKRRDTLLTAVIKAIKEANQCEVQESEMTSDKIFGYIIKGSH